MKYSKSSASCFFLLTAALSSGCDPTPSLPAAAKGYYSKESLGDLPAAPGGNKKVDVISLVQAAGEMPMYRVKKNAQIKSGENMSCEIRAGEMVDGIADAGSTLLVQAQRSSLARTCENSGDADFVEGYIDKSIVELVAQRPQAEGNGPQPPQQVPQTQMECESVRYGTYVNKKNAAIESTDALLIQFAYASGRPNTIPGALWRAGGEEFLIQVAGDAPKWKVQAFNKTNKNKKMKAVVLNSDSLKQSKKGLYQIPFKKFVEDPNDWVGVSIDVIITPQDIEGNDGKKSCKQQINLLSPLVLDFSNKDFIETTSMVQSGVEFDFNGDGLKEQVGWVHGSSAAFLVLDLNKNGRVDHGRELFGDSTLLRSGQTAETGFAALAEHDANGDGQLDARDPAFKKLKLWFDQNNNGVSEKNELVPLADRKVTSISLRHQTVARKTALQHRESLVPNDVRLSATFSAEGCPSQGCKVYDIWFGAITIQRVSKR